MHPFHEDYLHDNKLVLQSINFCLIIFIRVSTDFEGSVEVEVAGGIVATGAAVGAIPTLSTVPYSASATVAVAAAGATTT